MSFSLGMLIVDPQIPSVLLLLGATSFIDLLDSVVD